MNPFNLLPQEHKAVVKPKEKKKRFVFKAPMAEKVLQVLFIVAGLQVGLSEREMGKMCRDDIRSKTDIPEDMAEENVRVNLASLSRTRMKAARAVVAWMSENNVKLVKTGNEE